MEKSPSATPEALMTASEAAAYLGYALGTLYNKVAAQEIPHYRLKRSLRFRRSDLDAWLEDQLVEAATPMPPAA